MNVRALLKGLRRLIGIAILIWSAAAGGGLLRWLFFGERDGWGYDAAQVLLGCLVAGALWFVWWRIGEEDRDYVVATLTRWALVIAIAVAGIGFPIR